MTLREIELQIPIQKISWQKTESWVDYKLNIERVDIEAHLDSENNILHIIAIPHDDEYPIETLVEFDVGNSVIIHLSGIEESTVISLLTVKGKGDTT